MLEWVATALVLAGVAGLALGAWTIRQLIAALPARLLRRDWAIFLGFVAFFALGYLVYLAAFFGAHDHSADLIVPVIFFSGACFVAILARLMQRTALDLRRMTLLEIESATDALTGLPNRRAFDAQWNREVARATRFVLPLTLLIVDIDHFKRINDSYGHAAGDQVLAAVGRIISASLRETDFAARYGGEEFAVIAANAHPEGRDRVVFAGPAKPPES